MQLAPGRHGVCDKPLRPPVASMSAVNAETAETEEGVVAVLGDLRERQNQTGRELADLQALLQQQNAESRAVLESLRDCAIYTLSLNGRVQTWHHGAALMKGYSADEAIGMPFEALFTAADRAAGLPARELAAAAASGVYTGDGIRRRKDGITFEAAVMLTPLRTPQGELWGFLKLTRDISVPKRLEREREEMLGEAQVARSEAERANDAKDTFLSTLSHELRTPLSAILGWTHVLQLGACDPHTVDQDLAAIARNARVQVQLIDDLLDMNRIESGLVQLDLRSLELAGVISAAVTVATPGASDRGIALRWSPVPDTPAARGDAQRLQQVLSHLLKNAIKFSPDGGEVSVALSHTADSVQVDVADSGCGIAADFLPRVFDRFRQQDATSTRRHGGLGIGLALVRQIIALHGGSVQAQSPGPGLGSTFTVRLPVGVGVGVADVTAFPTAQDAAKEPADAGIPTHRLHGVKVLVVDDNDDLLAVTARMLQDAGAQVLTAANAERAPCPSIKAARCLRRPSPPSPNPKTVLARWRLASRCI